MKHYKKSLPMIFFTLWSCFIWANSLQNSAISGGRSGRVTALLNRLFSPLHITFTDHLVRKAAHFCEYAVLGILLAWVLYAWWRNAGGKLTLVLLAGIAVPLLDETIQLFIPGRAGMVQDVWLDYSGVLAGLAAFNLMLFIVRKIRGGGPLPKHLYR